MEAIAYTLLSWSLCVPGLYGSKMNTSFQLDSSPSRPNFHSPSPDNADVSQVHRGGDLLASVLNELQPKPT